MDIVDSPYEAAAHAGVDYLTAMGRIDALTPAGEVVPRVRGAGDGVCCTRRQTCPAVEAVANQA